MNCISNIIRWNIGVIRMIIVNFLNVIVYLRRLERVKGISAANKKPPGAPSLRGVTKLSILDCTYDASAASCLLLLSRFLSNSISIPIFDCVTRE